MTEFLHTLFPAVLNMSLTAIPVILAVMLVRMILKRVPKMFSYLLWAVVLFRLLCPISVTSGLSLLGALDAPTVPSSTVGTTVQYVRPMPLRPESVEPQSVMPQEPQTAPPAPLPAAPPEQKHLTAMELFSWIWLLGLVLLIAYSTSSLLRLHRKLMGSLRLRDNIYLSDEAETAFVMGILRPRIYLPSTIQEQEQQYILLHEQHHIRRGDPVWKLLAFLALAVHWFNPLVWISFVLAARDMEMSCDEAVVRKLGAGIRVDYSQSLLNLAAGRRLITAPLAFGEGDTRSRVTNVLNWKKPQTWVVLVASVACLVVGVACAANPADPSQERKQIGLYEGIPYVMEQQERQFLSGSPLPAPAEWAEQDLGGRNEAEALTTAPTSSTGQMLSAHNGWISVTYGAGVAAADTYFYRTEDGGATWQETSKPPIQWHPAAIAFLDKTSAMVGQRLFDGAPACITHDGGETWEELPIPEPDAEIIRVEQDGKRVALTLRGAKAYAMRSSNLGKTWTTTVEEPTCTGQYLSLEDYVAQRLADRPPTLKLYTDGGNAKEVEFRTLGARLDRLEELGHQPELDPEGPLSIWRYSSSIQLDLGAYDPNDVGAVGGNYTDEEGFYHDGGFHIAVTRSYPDGSIDVLCDEIDIDGTSFLNYQYSWDEALYDWYVQENDLMDEMPLFVQDWQTQIRYPEGVSMGNAPVHRVDGDGWYLYVPTQAWNAPFCNDAGIWEIRSAYRSGSSLQISRTDGSADALRQQFEQQGYTQLADGPLEKRDGTEVNQVYLVPETKERCMVLHAIWYPKRLETHWSPYSQTDPQVLALMAESFTIDERIQPDFSLEAALTAIRQANTWQMELPCEVWRLEGTGEPNDGDAGKMEQPLEIPPHRLAAHMQNLRELDASPKPSTMELRWMGQLQTIGLRASQTAGIVELRYSGGSKSKQMTFEDPELYTWLVALQEHPGTNMDDIDGDGVQESWFYGPDLWIYDFYDGEVHIPALPDYRGGFVHGLSNEEEYPPEYRFLLLMGGYEHEINTHMFSYRDGNFTDLGTVNDVWKELGIPGWGEDYRLETHQDPMSYEERKNWLDTPPASLQEVGETIPCGSYVEEQDTLLYARELVGTAHGQQYQLVLRFSDGTEALLPLPRTDEFHVLLPEKMQLEDGVAQYTVTISLDDAKFDSPGVYHYTVDLAEKTVSLLVGR